MSEWTCKSVGLRIIELPKSVFPAGMAEDIGSYPFFCSSPVVKKINHWLHDGNTILMGTGGVATVHYGQNRFAYSTDTWAFTVADSATNISFLFRQFEHKLKQIEYFGFEGSGLKHLQKEYIRKLELLTPPLNEQNVVVKVLDTIDTAIQQTQAIINKLKQLKQGLLHDLLTRGVDAKGELRPCYEDAPHLYKESPLGWIPKEWEVTQVGNEVSIEHGFAFAGGLFTNEPIGPVLLVPGNFHRDGELYFTPHNTKYFTGKYPKETVLSRGDLLVVMTDLSPMTLILGRTAILQEKHLVLHNQRIGKYIFKSKKDWSTSFFSSFMNDDRVRTRIIAEATGTTVRHTSPERIKDCYIAKPSLDEQKKIDSHLLAIHTRLDLEKNNLLKLIQQKTALMDDLLTGRIRVTSLLQTEASSV
ncbi:MAG: restriction endonuclease subunit S [Agitococcus sp.]|jgi:type I restriction enzyme S subunit|nr:restriction endonuclease subunit S [Agitococcus sp.]